MFFKMFSLQDTVSTKWLSLSLCSPSSSSSSSRNKHYYSSSPWSILLYISPFILLLQSLCFLIVPTQGLTNNDQSGHKLVISPTGETTNQPAKQAFFLTCKGSGGEPTLFTDLKWFDPRGEEITNVYTRDRNPDIRMEEIFAGHLLLHFQKPRPDDSGQYKCRALFQRSDPLEASITVQFFEDVTWEDCPEIQALVNGEANERIRCRASANPKPNLRWLKDSSNLDETRYIIDPDGVRISGNVNEADGGRFHVRALVTETGKLHDRFITVQVYVRPQISSLPESFEGTEGEETTLQCDATGTPEPIYTWLDPNRRNLSTVGGYNVNRNTGSLTITKVRKIDDRGEFTCIAENAAGKVEQKTNFLVTVKPSINSFMNVSYDINRESRLECRALGDPRPDLSIRKDGSPPFIEGAGRVAFERRNEGEETVLIITIRDTQREDDGLYYCKAQHRNGQHAVERVGHLQVRFPPDLSQTPLTTAKTWELRPVNVTCIAESIPNATINWWYRGVQLFNGRDNLYSIDDSIAGVSRLFVKPAAAPGVSQRDIYGAYKCEAENPLGRAEMTIKLEQAFRPAAILQITHERITPTTITFRLVGPTNDGGLPVKTIHVQYRKEENVWEQMISRSWPASAGNTLGQHGPYFLDGLIPRTRYIFKFSAENEVGIGDYGTEKHLTTEPESHPDKPVFHNLPFDANTNEIISP